MRSIIESQNVSFGGNRGLALFCRLLLVRTVTGVLLRLLTGLLTTGTGAGSGSGSGSGTAGADSSAKQTAAKDWGFNNNNNSNHNNNHTRWDDSTTSYTKTMLLYISFLSLYPNTTQHYQTQRSHWNVACHRLFYSIQFIQLTILSRWWDAEARSLNPRRKERLGDRFNKSIWIIWFYTGKICLRKYNDEQNALPVLIFLRSHKEKSNVTSHHPPYHCSDLAQSLCFHSDRHPPSRWLALEDLIWCWQLHLEPSLAASHRVCVLRLKWRNCNRYIRGNKCGWVLIHN